MNPHSDDMKAFKDAAAAEMKRLGLKGYVTHHNGANGTGKLTVHCFRRIGNQSLVFAPWAEATMEYRNGRVPAAWCASQLVFTAKNRLDDVCAKGSRAESSVRKVSSESVPPEEPQEDRRASFVNALMDMAEADRGLVRSKVMALLEHYKIG
jgi:hypothetical protein